MPCIFFLPWWGTPSVRHESKIKTSVEKCFFAVKPRVVLTSRSLLLVTEKDVLPASLSNKVVYNIL